jgi:hypothetical protein
VTSPETAESTSPSSPAAIASTPLSIASSSALLAGMEAMEVSTQTDSYRPNSPPPRYELIDVRRDIYSDLESESDSEDVVHAEVVPEVIQDRDRDLSLLPQSLARAFRRIRPIPAGLTPPRMPRVTNYSWAGAGGWEEAAGLGETIRSESTWTSLEAEAIDDIFRPVRSFADARFRLAEQGHPFVDDDDDGSILSVDSYGNCLPPLDFGDEMRPRGRARADARPPGTGPCLPSQETESSDGSQASNGKYKYSLISNSNLCSNLT